MKRPPCVISVSDHAGWAHIVSVAPRGNVPAVVDRLKVRTIDGGVPTMPYHHETLRMDETAGNALIARVRQSVDSFTSRALSEVIAALDPSYAVRALAIREPPFAELPDSVTAVHESYQLQCAADGMLYQRAWCDAARSLGLAVYQYRRGQEVTMAAARLGVAAREIESFVTENGRPPGPPWADEHRRAFTAGIVALAACVEAPLELSTRSGHPLRSLHNRPGRG